MESGFLPSPFVQQKCSKHQCGDHHGQKASLVSLSESQKAFYDEYSEIHDSSFNRKRWEHPCLCACVCVCVCVCVYVCLESSKNTEQNLSQPEEIPEDSIEKFQSRS